MKKILRWLGIVLGVIAGLLLIVAAGMYISASSDLNRVYSIPAENVVIPTDVQSIENGRRWVEANCTGCHGADLSGIAMVDDPMFGHLDSANLTPGKGGAGATFTDADWVRAIRHGVDEAGQALLIMPSNWLWYLNDNDLGEIIAYLKTLPPVDHETTIELSFLAKIMIARDPVATPAKNIAHAERPADVSVGVTIEYGGYLVNVSGCRECHSADLAGKPAIEGDPSVPDLTPGGELQGWSAEAFVNTMRTGVNPGGHQLAPEEMPWKEYAHYSDGELQAIFLYLQSLPTE